MWIKILIPVIAASLIGWGAWTTVEVTGATPREVHDELDKELDEHKADDNIKFMEVLKEIQEQREKIEEKLDRIQEKL